MKPQQRPEEEEEEEEPLQKPSWSELLGSALGFVWAFFFYELRR